MIKKAQRELMHAYLFERLKQSGERVGLVKMTSGIGDLNVFIVGNDGAVLLVDREFTNSSFDSLWKYATSMKKRVAGVICKDSETFFIRTGETEPSRRNRPFLAGARSMAPRNLGKTAGQAWASSRTRRLRSSISSSHSRSNRRRSGSCSRSK